MPLQGDISEWCRLLALDQYLPCLVHQGYDHIDTVTDITWEDLEDIGIKLLGESLSLSFSLSLSLTPSLPLPLSLSLSHDEAFPHLM